MYVQYYLTVLRIESKGLQKGVTKAFVYSCYTQLYIGSIYYSCTVILRLTKTIISGIAFVSRNELLEWPDRSCLLLYVSAHIH